MYGRIGARSARTGYLEVGAFHKVLDHVSLLGDLDEVALGLFKALLDLRNDP